MSVLVVVLSVLRPPVHQRSCPLVLLVADILAQCLAEVLLRWLVVDAVGNGAVVVGGCVEITVPDRYLKQGTTIIRRWNTFLKEKKVLFINYNRYNSVFTYVVHVMPGEGVEVVERLRHVAGVQWGWLRVFLAVFDDGGGCCRGTGVNGRRRRPGGGDGR